MFGSIISACVLGIEGQLIEVEVDISSGLPQVNVVGLPDPAVRESAERVRAAIKNCGFAFPMERITVNLAPADVKKEGSAFDLAIAVGILSASGQMNPGGLRKALVLGELALDGRLRPVTGVLPMVQKAREAGFGTVVLPRANAAEAALVEGMEIVPKDSLSDFAVWPHRQAPEAAEPTTTGLAPAVSSADSPKPSRQTEEKTGDRQERNTTGHSDGREYGDYADVYGQHFAKRALMIAAAGMHNVLLTGPPGSGKTMLARRLPGILPDMSDQEALEVTKIYSVAGKLTNRAQLMRTRPFRAPHHTISAAGMAGGGAVPKPGEISLAHGGVLFLDELPEFSRSVLEALRQPLEERAVTISRAKAHFTFPARFILAASMNPCPCGYWGAETERRRCSCSPRTVRRYRAKISGPLLDRIDLHVDVPRIEYGELAESPYRLTSAQMRETVARAHRIQRERYRHADIRFNGELSGRLLREHCAIGREAGEVLRQTFELYALSARAHDRILRIARTIADLEGSADIGVAHIAEAVQYRRIDSL